MNWDPQQTNRPNPYYPQAQPQPTGLGTCSIVLGVIVPIVGLVLGIVAATRPAKEDRDRGIAGIVVSVLFFIIWAAVLSAIA